MIARTAELKQLQGLYESTGNQIVLLYGDHQCEKEGLVFSFCRDKKYFYYRGRNTSREKQLASFQEEVARAYDAKLLQDSYDECFNRIRSGDSSKLVVVIDEFQTVAKNDATFFESLIKLKKHQLYPGPVMVILLNSSLIWTRRSMEEALGEGYAYLDAVIELGSFSFLDLVRSFPAYSVADAVALYGIIGGTSGYLSRWDGKRSIRDNVCRLMLEPQGALFYEAEDYIRRELRELGVYDTILYGLSIGREKLNDLYRFTGFSRAKISVYLKNLAAFDVVEKVTSFETVGWENTKKGIYRMKHPFLHFWFRFIYPHQSMLWTMEPEEFFDTYIAGELQDYLAPYFSKVCGEYLELLNMVGKTPIRATRFGTWLGKEGTIDIVAMDEEGECVVGICNWAKPTLTYGDYQSLLYNMKQAHLHARVTYLFSATAFDERLSALAAEEPTVELVDMREL